MYPLSVEIQKQLLCTVSCFVFAPGRGCIFFCSELPRGVIYPGGKAKNSHIVHISKHTHKREMDKIYAQAFREKRSGGEDIINLVGDDEE